MNITANLYIYYICEVAGNLIKVQESGQRPPYAQTVIYHEALPHYRTSDHRKKPLDD